MTDDVVTATGRPGGTMSPVRLHVDQVGSFRRPPALLRAIRDFEAGAINRDRLVTAQDDAIRGVIAQQERCGMPLVTDGEFRRMHFMESFAQVAGSTGWTTSITDAVLERSGSGEQGYVDPVHRNRVPATERLRLIANRPLAEYAFAARVATRPVKITLIGPERIAQGHDPERSIPRYRSHPPFVADVVEILRQTIEPIVAAGCTYVQMDAPGFTAYVDERSRQTMRAAGRDPDEMMQAGITAENAVIAGFPGVTFGIHVCRGNRKSQSHRQGHYDAIAERLFSQLQHDRLLLEYDTDAAGGFEPLRFVRPGTVVVLGLVTTKHGTLEDPDELKRRIEEAARYVPIERLALSPQCGFSSTIDPNLISDDQQWRKLELVREVAAQVWGN